MVAATYYRICPIVEKRYNFADYDGCVYGVQFNLVKYDDGEEGQEGATTGIGRRMAPSTPPAWL